MALTITAVKEALVRTISPDRNVRRSSQQELSTMQRQPEFCHILLQIIEGSGINLSDVNEVTAQHSAAIYFKNYIKKGYNPDESVEEAKISDTDKAFVKQNIVNLMCQVPNNLMQQLTESVRLIGEVDFPYNWKNLIPDIKAKLLSTQDFRVIKGMLETLNTLFKMFRDTHATDELWLKIKYVLEELQEDLLTFFIKATELVKTGIESQNANLNVELLACVRLMCRIFYSLNWQTIPEFYEDNMQTYMTNFHFYLQQTDYEKVKSKLQTKPLFELWLRIQSAVLSNLKLYAEKYDEEFQPVLGTFTESAWNLLTKCDQSDDFDEIVSTGLAFLSTVVGKTANKPLFEKQGILNSICDKIVLPNLATRIYDLENFEFNPIDYIRGDLEGGDRTSRRKNTIELVRSISKNFEGEMTAIMHNAINSVFNMHNASEALSKLASSKSPEEFEKLVKSYDICITLFIAVSAKNYSYSNGVSELNNSINLPEFTKNVIFAVLDHYSSQITTNENLFLNLLLCDCLKFVLVFRQQVDDKTNGVMNRLVTYLKSSNFVVSSYAAIAIERALAVRNKETKVLKYTFNDLQPNLGDLLNNCFTIIEQRLVEENEYNEYAMKTIMRVLVVAKEGLASHKDVMLEKLYAILIRICPNPQNPSFNHYLFECLAAVITYSITVNNQVDAKTIETFETKLFPLFQQILTQDVSELMSYVFQIMAQLLEASAKANRPLPQSYVPIFSALLAPVLWRDKGYQVVLVRLLNAFLRLNVIGSGDKQSLEGLLGVFQKLMATNSTESQALKLLTSIVMFVESSMYTEHLKTIFEIIFRKYQSKKSNVQSKISFCVFLSLLITKVGLSPIEQLLENMFQGLFMQTVSQLFLPNLEKIHDSTQVKSVVIGAAHILTESEGFFNGPAAKVDVGKQLFAKVILIVSDAYKAGISDEDVQETLASLEEGGYSSGFVKLTYSREPKLDPFSSVVDCEVYFLTKISEYSQKKPGVVQPFVQQALANSQKVGKNKVDLQGTFSKLLTKSGVSIA